MNKRDFVIAMLLNFTNASYMAKEIGQLSMKKNRDTGWRCGSSAQQAQGPTLPEKNKNKQNPEILAEPKKKKVKYTLLPDAKIQHMTPERHEVRE